MAMLFSLTGVGCIVANQWYTSVERNLEQINSLIKGEVSLCTFIACLQHPHNNVGLLSENKTVGRVHWLTSRRKELQCENEEENTDIPNCVVYGLPHLTFLKE